MNRLIGRKLVVEGMDFYLFPTAERIANTDLNALLEAKLGFHAKFVKAAAHQLVTTDFGSKIDAIQKSQNGLDASRETSALLTTLDGVGKKVADCVMLYSLGLDHVFPLDVWGQRIVTDYYNLDLKMKYDEMSDWVYNYFGEYAGWAGQYLYEYIRLHYPKTSKNGIIMADKGT